MTAFDDALATITMFQSPSFRGGSTPYRLLGLPEIGSARFNPLRFGAGALPLKMREHRRLVAIVSIPFVSGREHSPR